MEAGYPIEEGAASGTGMPNLRKFDPLKDVGMLGEFDDMGVRGPSTIIYNIEVSGNTVTDEGKLADAIFHTATANGQGFPTFVYA